MKTFLQLKIFIGWTEEDPVKKFRGKLEEHLKDYRKICNFRDKMLEQIVNPITQTDELMIKCLRKELILDKARGVLAKETGLLKADFAKTMSFLRENLRKTSTDLGMAKSFWEILSEFRKEMDIINDSDDKIYRLERGIDEFLKILSEVMEKKQAKTLLLVSKKFIGYEGGEVFSFFKETRFGIVPMDLFLKNLGVSKKTLFNIFKKLIKSTSLFQEHKVILGNYEENMQKPTETPKKNSDKTKKYLER